MQLHKEFISLARRARIRRQRPVVSVIAVQQDDQGHTRILMQRRHNIFDDTPYKGYWEIPQGKIDRNETITEAATREVEEESGLVVTRFLMGGDTSFELKKDVKSKLTTAQPLICVVDSLQNHFAICVVVETKGEVKKTLEARSHQWTDKSTIRTLIDSGKVFPLNVPMLTEYLNRY